MKDSFDSNSLIYGKMYKYILKVHEDLICYELEKILFKID